MGEAWRILLPNAREKSDCDGGFLFSGGGALDGELVGNIHFSVLSILWLPGTRVGGID